MPNRVMPTQIGHVFGGRYSGGRGKASPLSRVALRCDLPIRRNPRLANRNRSFHCDYAEKSAVAKTKSYAGPKTPRYFAGLNRLLRNRRDD